MSPTSLLEEAERTEHGINDEMGKEDRGFSSRNTVSTEVERSLANQRERSMQLNSEGLEVGTFLYVVMHLVIKKHNLSFRNLANTLIIIYCKIHIASNIIMC